MFTMHVQLDPVGFFFAPIDGEIYKIAESFVPNRGDWVTITSNIGGPIEG